MSEGHHLDGGPVVSNSRREKTRVCHVITRLDAGGAAENTLRTVCGLDPERYEVSLIYGRTEQPMTEWIRRAEARGVALHCLPAMVREIRPMTDLRAIGQLYRLLGRLRPHIVHTHSSKAGILGRWAARLRRVPCIVHTPHGHIFYGYYGPVLSRLFRAVERATCRFTHRVVALTDAETEQHLEAKVGRREQFVTIHSGVEVERFEQAKVEREAVRERLRVPPGAFCIGSAGRLVAVKNFGLLLDALSRLHHKDPDCYHLVILGEGAERGMLLHQSLDLGLHERFYLPGWFEDMENYYPAFDLFVLGSKNEGMGRVLVEAMAAGIPVAATAVGGVPELLGRDEWGLLVPPDDPQAMAEAIERAACQAELRARLAQKGKERCRLYTAERMIQEIDCLYGQLLNEQGRCSK
ncbi:MAG TPA: glycosyltransferase family 1 protein [Firmicutes bacterium]|nr:glycosyltransferase family 1 protein [Bacillota bacterium]